MVFVGAPVLPECSFDKAGVARADFIFIRGFTCKVGVWIGEQGGALLLFLKLHPLKIFLDRDAKCESNHCHADQN